MQNNVTELTQKLLRSLDSNYNVIDMPTVTEVISLLERIAITKELLETTRLGKHVNELRRKTRDESLAKRAKELVKKWRNLVLPDSNGQLKPSPNATELQQQHAAGGLMEDAKNKKRFVKDRPENLNIKRSRINGTNELDLSDNSNSSFKDVINMGTLKSEPKKDIILINSDSNSSLPDGKNDPVLEQQQPKKRGRKKGSRNHRNLIDEAETSFSNKMAVSRGNAKVKTTQELIASLQNKNTNSTLNLPSISKSKEDLVEKAAKLTERVSIIDQKLNTNANRYKNSAKRNARSDKVIESGSFTNVRNLPSPSTTANSSHTDDEIIIVDEEVEVKPESEYVQSEVAVENVAPKSLSVDEALASLPPIDKSCLDADVEEAICSCMLKEHKSDFSVEEEAEVLEHRFEFLEDCNCQAKTYLGEKYHVGSVTDDRIVKLHGSFIPNVNGNYSMGHAKREPEVDERGLYVNVVPNVNKESIPKCADGKSNFSSENFKKYSISDSDEASTCLHQQSEFDDSTLAKREPGVNSDNSVVKSDEETFREWHEVVELPSYNGEILKILPYVIID